jgi:putative FmdB family regulatory protein
MPLYEYQCSKCGNVFEVIQKYSDAPLKKHQGCGGKVEKLISAPSFQFKGSGWYVTDYGRGGVKPESQTEAQADAKSDAKSEGKSDAKSEGKTEPKTESKTESKSGTKTESKSESKTESKSVTKKESKPAPAAKKSE